ncbi:MAG: hypothetical protein M1400_00160 [Patescibacteria group bacterium]|nr:hypothetical protein [Patescibacteria group bacterium]
MFQDNKQQIYAIAGATLLSAFSLGAVLMFTDPGQASAGTFGFFYLSVFLFAFGTFTLLGLSLRRWLAPKMFVLNFYTSLRQALLVALLLVVSLLLLGQRLLFWWVELSLVLLLLSIEFFLSLKS